MQSLPPCWPYIRFLFVVVKELLHHFLHPSLAAFDLWFTTLGSKYLWSDFHRLAVCHARHTTEMAEFRGTLPSLFNMKIFIFYLYPALLSRLFSFFLRLVCKGYFQENRSYDSCDNNHDYDRSEESVIHKTYGLTLVCDDKSNFAS